MRRGRILRFIAILNLLWGCKQPTPEIPKTSNQVLNRYLTESPATILSLDGFPVDTLQIQEKDLLGRKPAQSFSDSAFIGGITGLVKIQNRLYIADQIQDCLWEIDSRSGRLVRKIGRKGKGPGEFVSLQGIYSNSKNVFTYDMGIARVNVYDHQLKLKSFFTHVLSGLQMDMAVTDSLLFMPTKLNVGNDSLFMLRRASPPFTKLTHFLLKISKHKFGLSQYNVYYIDSNKKGEFVFGFRGLPYIFIYNQQLNHVHTLFLHFDYYVNGERVPLEPVIKKEGNKYKMTAFFSGIYLMDDGSMIVLKRGNLYQIKHSEKGYQLTQILYLECQDPRLKDEKMKHVFLTNIVTDSDTLYASSIFYPYVFRIPMK